MNAWTVGVFVLLFALVTVLGFAASRWRRVASLDSLDEWGLAGRRLGTFLAWFVIGADVYTAYTFIAVPAALYAGNTIGFYAVPNAIIVYPVIFLFLPRLWSVSHRHGYVTPADFVEGRYGSRALALAVAVTGVLATMPYIALQLVGMQAVLEVMGIGGHLPLFVAFVVLAAYTYTSGLRAPVLIAFVKDALVYTVILVAVIVLPARFGGWGDVFTAAQDSFAQQPTKGIRPPEALEWTYSSLALGSALALFLYPHSVTAVLATRSRVVIRRNAALLPMYTILLGLLALLGFVAVAADVDVTNPQQAVPQLFEEQFPPWFAGVAFAAIVIGALVPAAIMSIAAANLWTRNIYRVLRRRDATPAQETRQSQIASLLMKVGAVAFVLAFSRQFAINLQLLGSIWILQTLPAVVLGLYTRWLHRWGLLAGWAAAMGWGTWLAYRNDFGGPLTTIPGTETKIYTALLALVLNLVVAAGATLVLRRLGIPEGTDRTTAEDYVS